MPSFANGDFRLLASIQGSSPNSWYRLLMPVRRELGKYIGCDCPAWINYGGGPEDRECKHTRFYKALYGANWNALDQRDNGRGILPISKKLREMGDDIVLAIRRRWNMIAGTWSIQERCVRYEKIIYTVMLTICKTPDGTTARAVTIFRGDIDNANQNDIITAMVGWAGYGIMADLAFQNGVERLGEPPAHYIFKGKTPTKPRNETNEARVRRATLVDIVRIADQRDLGDGLTPEQRAEATLRMFLGDETYTKLSNGGYVDIRSKHFNGRSYRVRRDPAKRLERRLRVFSNFTYEKDFCIVRENHYRGQDATPEADFVLTLILGLLSDEMSIVNVVRNNNIFQTNSDGMGPRTEQPARFKEDQRMVVGG